MLYSGLIAISIIQLSTNIQNSWFKSHSVNFTIVIFFRFFYMYINPVTALTNINSGKFKKVLISKSHKLKQCVTKAVENR